MDEILNKILIGDSLEVLKTLPDGIVDTCVTSPPYWNLRDYGKDGQIGLELTPDEYIDKLVEVFREVKRVLKDDGVLWVNIGDTYSTHGSGSKATPHNFRKADVAAKNGIGTLPKGKTGLPEKNLVGIPWKLAFALQKDGWILRNDIIWDKPNNTPDSVKDRLVKSHEYIFMLSKQHNYYFDYEAIMEDRVNGDGKKRKRTVWTVKTKPYKGAHFAVFPQELIEPCILAGSREGGVVIDPFMGSGTTGLTALQNGRKFIGVELNPDYAEIALKRIKGEAEQTTIFEMI